MGGAGGYTPDHWGAKSEDTRAVLGLRCGHALDSADVLDRLGIREETVVIWTADHGYQMWEHKLFLKFNMREASVHVPLLIDDPRVGPGVRQEPVEHVDLFLPGDGPGQILGAAFG